MVSDPNSRISPVAILGGAVGLIVLLAWYNLGRFEHGVMLMALSGGTMNFHHRRHRHREQTRP